MTARHRLALEVFTLALIACGGGSDGSTGPGSGPPPPPAPPPPPPAPAFPAPPLVATVPVPADYGLHDTFVRDGIAVLSAWNTGIIILDVGGGTRGGTPSHPVEIARFRPSNGSLTSPSIHNAWWFHNPDTGEKRYLFLGQEGPMVIGSSSSGDVKVIDVSDMAAPVEVAFYRLAGAGAHNFWVDESRQVFYAAMYNGGIVALDVSGTLQGDLANRVLARKRPSGGSTYTWGVMVSAARLYAIDLVWGIMQLDPVTLNPLSYTTSNERWHTDMWVKENYAYTGTWGGSPREGNRGDRVKVWEIAPDGAPTLVDSISVKAMTTGDVEVCDTGRLLVIAAEPGLGGSEGGLHIYQLTDPRRPVKVGFAPVTSGLHTVTLARIGGKLYAFGARNPVSPALLIYDLSQFEN